MSIIKTLYYAPLKQNLFPTYPCLYPTLHLQSSIRQHTYLMIEIKRDKLDFLGNYNDIKLGFFSHTQTQTPSHSHLFKHH